VLAKTTSQVLREYVAMIDAAWSRYPEWTDEGNRPYKEATRILREAAEQKQREGD
jgi:hypothetical protein